MKLKIKITGPKVHEVGYRYFLMSNAIDLGLGGFHARNRPGEKEQVVIALVDGDRDAVEDFKNLVVTEKPDQAEVSNIGFEDYTGEVMRAGEYAQVCTALQLNKATPALLEIRDVARAIKDDTKAIQDTAKAIKDNTDTMPQMAEDIEGLREDLIEKSDDRLARMEKDIPGIFIYSYPWLAL